jgi:hypothetical protein
MFRKKKIAPQRLRIDLPQVVWFMLIEVEVTGSSVQPWIAGSRALVQAFVPARRLEEALTLLDTYLPIQELVRIDTLQAIRHDSDEEWDELPNDHYREPLQDASRRNE